MREAGLDRFEVRGLLSDKPLLRAIAQRLARGDAAAGKLRAIFEVAVTPRRDPR